ncbi:unnamed protein product [Notodromas monacha]|uniref:Thioredoxin domain-containing protein n=1 Tax=Notodromas monacha TaxID=399045 RepID=A0A7R9BHL0_9CRUS|nr:unnamed protein product [Notodromas monacha]CAG0914815.1 unnamed protein product [Notodromas monacha]
MEIINGKKLVKRDGSTLDAESALSSSSVIGFYFSAHWCPPCRAFTPVLADFYDALRDAGEGFEIIFVSSDRSEAEMLNYMKDSHGDWFAVPFNSAEVRALKEKFQVSGIPCLVILGKNGQLITKDGRSAINSVGPSVMSSWKEMAI